MPQSQNRVVSSRGRPASTAKKVLGNVLRLPAVRLSFPDLFEAVAFQDGQEAKFGATFLLNPRNPKHVKAIEAVEAEEARMIREAWGENPPPKLIVEYIGNGNDRTNQQTGEIYDGYQGMIYITAKAKTQPLVLDPEKIEIAAGDPRVFAGVFCNATINLYIQANKWGNGIRASVRAVMPLGYGEPFGAGRVSEKEFDDFDADDGTEYTPTTAAEIDDGL